jgi:hypothetical protein
MTPPEIRSISTALARRAGPQANANEFADAVVALWRDIDAALAPIIGTHGLAALHGRSLYLASREFAWLKAESVESVLKEIDFNELRRTFSAQPMQDAQAAASTVFRCFHELLTSMVGVSLTDRLLHPVWDNSFGGEAAQDVSA